MPYTIVWNPSSNRGKSARKVAAVSEELAARDLDAEMVESESPEHMASIAASAEADGRVPVAMGGDGTVNIVMNACRGPIGIIPTGTANALAVELGIPEGEISKAIDVLVAGEPRKIDMARISVSGEPPRLMNTTFSMGFAADATATAERINWIKGDLRYVYAVFPTLAKGKPYEFRVTLDDGEEELIPAWMVMVTNVKDAGGGMMITPESIVDDGLFDICVLGPITRRRFIRTFPRVFRGRHVDDPWITMLRASKISVETDRESICYIDGDRHGSLPATLEVLPGELSVIAPS